MKRCSHRSNINREGECWLTLNDLNDQDDLRMIFDSWKDSYTRYVFQHDGRGDARHKPEYRFRDRAKCDEAMVAVCPFIEWKPKPKIAPLNPRDSWIKCQYCGGRHMRQETANTCRFYHEEFSRLEGQRTLPWLPDGSKEKWPPYETSITGDMIWHSMVDKIVLRDQMCCTDCGISWAEIKASDNALVHNRFQFDREDHDYSNQFYEYYQESIRQYPSFEVHHIIARVKGGTHHPNNLRLLCSNCHRKYTNGLLSELSEEKQLEKARTPPLFVRPLEV
jgi:hypothetical protein